MNLFRLWEPAKVAVCCAVPAMTRRAADWLRKLGGCRPIAVLSDECEDVVWQCATEQVDLLLLETDFSDGVTSPPAVRSPSGSGRRCQSAGSASSPRWATRKSRPPWTRPWSCTSSTATAWAT